MECSPASPFLLLKNEMYVSRHLEMKCRHPERNSGTALLTNLCLSLFLSLFSLCRMALKTVSQSLKYCILRLGDLVTRLSNTKKGRQELRLQSVVNKKTNSGTRLRSDPSYVAINPVFHSCFLCRMALGHISKL